MKNPFTEKLIRDSVDLGMDPVDAAHTIDVQLMEETPPEGCPCGGKRYYYHPVGAMRCSTCRKYDFQCDEREHGF